MLILKPQSSLHRALNLVLSPSHYTQKFVGGYLDTIYVLEQGKIVECGHHDDLIRHNGTYAQLFERQSQHYR